MGLNKLNQQEFNRILRSEIIKESLIYQEILAKSLTKGKLKTVRHIALNLICCDLECLLSRLVGGRLIL